MPTFICTPITAESAEDVDRALGDAQVAKDLGADLVEFRVDPLFTADPATIESEIAACIDLCKRSPLPVIMTCRSAEEGGSYEGDDSSRISLYEALGTSDYPPRYLDLELATYKRSANLRQKVHLAVDHPNQLRDLSTSLILSAHDFEKRPANLYQIVSDMLDSEACAINKVAFRARSLRDNIEIADLLAERARPTIALGMGEFGLPSRVLAPKFNAFLTFASLRDSAATAPGQPTIAELIDRYRFRSITPSTKVYAVAGWPVHHSISPDIHNAAFEQANHDGVYLPFPIPSEWEHFKATMLAIMDAEHLDFSGASITIPHKEHMLKLATEDTTRSWHIEPIAVRTGVANTLYRNDAGEWSITNTDVEGAIRPLQSELGELRGRKIAVFGAGGAAQGIAIGLADSGVELVICNRSVKRGEELVQKINSLDPLNGLATPAAKYVQPENLLSDAPFDAIINCTPLGMAGSGLEDQNPLQRHISALAGSDILVFDTVYTPRETPLIRSACDAGLRTIVGETMFTTQALGQFERWTGKPVPQAFLQKTASQALEARRQ
ncbi:MAG: type I 3-dehydroquinate dehydratase [Planctomycetota bacterium]